MTTADPPTDLATADEVRSAIENLSDDDALRIWKAGRAFLWGTEFDDPDELLGEAMLRAIEAAGKVKGRHWPKATPFVAFVIMTMKSIADGSRESDYMSKTVAMEDMANEFTGDAHPMDLLGHFAPSVEEELIEAKGLAMRAARAGIDAGKIDAYFADDQEVAWLILCLKEDRKPSKARETAGLTQTEYETARRRMRRGIEQLFPNRSKR